MKILVDKSEVDRLERGIVKIIYLSKDLDVETKSLLKKLLNGEEI